MEQSQFLFLYINCNELIEITIEYVMCVVYIG